MRKLPNQKIAKTGTITSDFCLELIDKFDDNNVSKINTRDVLKKYQLESRILVYKGVKNN